MSLQSIPLALIFSLLITICVANQGPVSFAFPGMKSPSAASDDSATFVGTYNSGTKELFVDITHTVANVSMIHIHGSVSTAFTDPGAPWNQTAGVLLTIATDASEAASPVRKRFVLSAAEEAAICGMKTYFVIHSTSAPEGALGAVLFLDCDTRTILFDYNGQNSNGSNAAGVSFFGSYNPGSKVMFVNVIHNLTGIFALHIHGPTPFAFNLTDSPFLNPAAS